MNRERFYRFVLRALALGFALAGLSFLLTPDATITSLNRLGASLGDFEPAPASALRFWLTLAVAYMVLVTLLAWMAQLDLRRYRHLLALLFAGKASSSLLALAFYLLSLHAFVYLLNFFVDGAIALTALAIWWDVPRLPEPHPAFGERGAAGAGTGPRGVTSPLRRGRAALGRVGQRSLAAALEALVVPGEVFREGPDPGTLAQEAAGFVAQAGATPALRLLLFALELSPFLIPPIWWRRFSRLPLEDRVRALAAWEESRFAIRRQAVQLLKLVGMAHFYADAEVQARIGYPCPLDRVPLERASSPAEGPA